MTLEKICDVCGMGNPVTEMICQRCFSDISRKRPTEKTVNKPGLKPGVTSPPPRKLKKPELDQDKTIREVAPLQLVMSPGQIITIHHGDTIGRDTIGAKFLNQFSAISRRHASFKHMHARWLIRDENSTNGTYINGTKLEAEKWYEIKDKDVISLSSSCNLTVRI
jgi:hypothetical protein